VLLVSCALLAHPIVFGQAKAPSPILKISPVAPSVKVGAKVRLRIEFKNTSDHEISLPAVPWGNEDHPELKGFVPVVTDATGKEATLTHWGRLVSRRPNSSDNPPGLIFQMVGEFKLAPGQVYTSEIVLSDLYDLSVPGSYSVQVPHADGDPKKMGMSNTATITVVP
jgi:hypothetical protein